MSLLLLYNPVCGNRTAKQLVDEHVLPALKAGQATPVAIVGTERPGHAGELVLQFLSKYNTHSADVAVVSGDGTIHEIINALYENPASDSKPYVINFIIIPAGTANALFSSFFAGTPSGDIDSPAYKLQSVHAYLADVNPRPVNVTTTTVVPARPANHPMAVSAWRPRITVRSIVVTSTSLHASILHDSERLRASHPGIERFKIAAQGNITRWYHASVRLFPLPAPSSPEVLRYSPETRTFQVLNSGFVEDTGGAVALPDSAYSYFLSSSSVDRLEPEFCITPLMTRLPPSGPGVDVVVVRPLNDPSLNTETLEARTKFASKAGVILGGAYKGGEHVDLTYSENGDIVPYEEEHAGKTLPVEYFRCGGWEWAPVSLFVLCNCIVMLNLQLGLER